MIHPSHALGEQPPSQEPIHEFFGLSYAAYLVLPRSVLQSMPVQWQQKLVDLIRELDETIDWRQDGYRVSRVVDGTRMDDPFMDYERGRRRIPHRDKGPTFGCPKCGGDMVGDGHVIVRHCEFVDVTGECIEPDAGPIYCDFKEEQAKPLEEQLIASASEEVQHIIERFKRGEHLFPFEYSRVGEQALRLLRTSAT